MSTDKKDRFERQFDFELKEALYQYQAETANNLKNPIEKHEFSAEHEKRMEKLFAKERRKIKFKKFSKALPKIACILLALTVASGVSVFSVDAWRNRFLNFLYNKNAVETEYNFKGSSTEYKDEHVHLKYFPKNFKLIKKLSYGNAVDLCFEKDSYYLYVTVDSIESEFAIDTEDASVKDIKINEHDGKLIKKTNMNAVIWSDGYYAYNITGNIDSKEVLKIAKNIYLLF